MILFDRHRTDSASLFPAQTATAVMDVKNPGHWLLSCQIADHLSAGMFAFYNAKQCSSKPVTPTVTGTTREYFLTAEEVEWDYGPSGMNRYDGGALNKAGR